MVQVDGLKAAQFFATVKHEFFSKKGVPQRYSGLPYTHHLAAVEAVLRRFGFSDGTGSEHLVAAWLHDVVEDTQTKTKEIVEMFGARVGELVEAVTNEPGENRKARNANTYPKIRQCPGATALKLADRIANVEFGGAQGNMYKKEYEDFRRALYTPGEYEDMWAHLDGLMKE